MAQLAQGESMKYTDEQIEFIVSYRNQGYSFPEIAELFKEQYDLKKTADTIRKTYNKYGDIGFSDDTIVKNLQAAHRAKKSKGQVAKENRALLDYLQQTEDFAEKLLDINKQAPIKIHKKVKSKPKKKHKRTIVAHLSDTHIGACIDREELGELNEFNNTIAARRFAYFFREVAGYKRHYRKDTDLVVVLNGDILEGIIHNQEWGVDLMTTQFASGQRILTQGISYLANEFSSVKVVCTMGNHSRFTHKANKGRQTNAKWDGFGTMLYLSIRDTLQATHKNVTFEIPKTPYALIDIQGHNFFITHGDNVINVGNISSKVDVKNIVGQLNDIQVAMDKKIHVAMLGHVHRPMRQTLDAGTEIMVNGALSGTSSYGISLGIFSSNPVQQLFEVTPEHAVGDDRFVRLGKADDMEELDKIIEPLKGSF